MIKMHEDDVLYGAKGWSSVRVLVMKFSIPRHCIVSDSRSEPEFQHCRMLTVPMPAENWQVSCRRVMSLTREDSDRNIHEAVMEGIHQTCEFNFWFYPLAVYI